MPDIKKEILKDKVLDIIVSDGKTSSMTITEKSGIDIDTVISILEEFKTEGRIELTKLTGEKRYAVSATSNGQSFHQQSSYVSEAIKQTGMDRIYVNCDSCYKSSLDFKDTVSLLESTNEAEALPLETLVIEIDEGVFIRSKDSDCCMWLDKLCMVDKVEIDISEISYPEWVSLTSKYRAPKESTGDVTLVRWRVGF